MPQMYRIIAERRVQRRIDPLLVTQQVQGCANKALSGSRGQGWKCTMPSKHRAPREEGDVWVYQVMVDFQTTSKRASLLDKWPRIVKRFAEAGAVGNLRKSPWRVIEPKGYSGVADEATAKEEEMIQIKALAEEPKELGEICLEPGNHYARLFNRTPHVNRVHDALGLAVQTDWRKRTHTLLDGPPGCGKTELMLSTRRMLGKENEAWLWFDATSMTRAGVIELIMKNSKVPPVMFIEEIEKCPEQELRWLLGAMDTRGEIRRTNYRVGNEGKNVRVVVIASANDVKLLKTIMSGALYSRFQNKVYCEPPDRPTMAMILEREMNEIQGKREWIEPTLQFGYDKWCIQDPRDLITIFSLGKDRLLDGSFQKDYEATMHPMEQRVLERRRIKREKQREKQRQDESPSRRIARRTA